MGENERKAIEYIRDCREGKHPRMSGRQIYNEWGGLTLFEVLDEFSIALDVLNTIAESFIIEPKP